jgi:hypothetical protein
VIGGIVVDFRDYRRLLQLSSTVAIPLAVQATDYSKHCKLGAGHWCTTERILHITPGPFLVIEAVVVWIFVITGRLLQSFNCG